MFRTILIFFMLTFYLAISFIVVPVSLWLLFNALIWIGTVLAVIGLTTLRWARNSAKPVLYLKDGAKVWFLRMFLT